VQQNDRCALSVASEHSLRALNAAGVVGPCNEFKFTLTGQPAGGFTSFLIAVRIVVLGVVVFEFSCYIFDLLLCR